MADASSNELGVAPDRDRGQRRTDEVMQEKEMERGRRQRVWILRKKEGKDGGDQQQDHKRRRGMSPGVRTEKKWVMRC